MTDPKSISSGLTLPQWLRSRNERNDLDGINFSPPPHDESFFYIRYPVSNKKSDSRSISSILHGETPTVGLSSDAISNHTEPCRKFLNASGGSVDSANPLDIKHPPKPFGTDDGFKGPGAACGSSIVKVAQKMVSGRSITGRGFKIANLEEDQVIDESDDNEFQTKTIEDQQLQTSKLIKPEITHSISNDPELLQMTKSSRFVNRRGSKSLPASPTGSPKVTRKFQPNPYFTGSVFVSIGNNQPEARNWFLSSLLGAQRPTTTSTTSITQIDEEVELAPAPTKKLQDRAKIVTAKPSEYREMNFWSPTSM